MTWIERGRDKRKAKGGSKSRREEQVKTLKGE